jgi:hypothetical protein
MYGRRLVRRNPKIEFEVANLPVEVVLVIPPGLATAAKTRYVNVRVESRVSNDLPSFRKVAVDEDRRPLDGVTWKMLSAQSGIAKI